MVIYEKTERRLIIPTGRDIPLDIVLPASGDCAEAIAEARLQGYNSGISDGKAAQMAIDNAKLTPTINIIQNGEYVADYGYKKVVVDVPTSGDCSEAIAIAYQSGYTAGQADCPDCPPCPSGDCSEEKAEAYSSGITAGVAEQKAKLVSTAITQNGTYTRENGWNSVTVNISQKKQAIIGTIEATGVDMIYAYLDIQNCAGGMHTDWAYELDGFPNVGDSGLSMYVPTGTHTLNIYTDSPEDRIATKNPTDGVWTSVQFWQLNN